MLESERDVEPAEKLLMRKIQGRRDRESEEMVSEVQRDKEGSLQGNAFLFPPLLWCPQATC